MTSRFTRTEKRMLLSVFIATIIIGFVVLFMVNPARATQNIPTSGADVCAGLDSGKVDVMGDHKVVPVTAPDGMLIAGYCVKAGSVKQGNGPVYVTLEQPAKAVGISHPSGKDVSHYSLRYVQVTPDPEPEPTPDPEPEPTPDPEPEPEPTEEPVPTEEPEEPETPAVTPETPVEVERLAETGPVTEVMGWIVAGLLAIATGYMLLRKRKS